MMVDGAGAGPGEGVFEDGVSETENLILWFDWLKLWSGRYRRSNGEEHRRW